MNNSDDYNDDLDLAVDGETIELQVPNDLAGKRLDAALAQLLPDYSRSRITTWIKDGLVIINDLEEGKTFFFKDGAARKTEFTIKLTIVRDWQPSILGTLVGMGIGALNRIL